MSRRSITNNFFGAFLFIAVVLPASVFCNLHSLAILAPEKNAAAEDFARVLADQIQKSFDVIDLSMADAAFRSADVAEPFNQTVESAKNLAEIIGCEYFILIRTTNQRRAGIGRPDYFEASAAVFLVSGRTGKLLSFRLYNREATATDAAARGLNERTGEIGDEISAAITGENAGPIPEFALPPEPAPQTFRAPVPYKRMKPDYTEAAMIYGVEATVDVSVDIDAEGNILRTDIMRWAGYGLDESVTQNIRRMNWRPAELAGKYLPMRILLRYNFKDIQNPE